MSHDENSASGNPFEEDDDSIGGLSTSFGDDLDEDGSQAIESEGEDEDEEAWSCPVCAQTGHLHLQ